MLLLLVAAATSAQGPLSLVCVGQGSANKQQVTSIYDDDGEWANATTNRSESFADQTDVRLFTGDDRIRLPRKMLPPIRGGDGGWFKLKSVEVSDREITASAAINFMNSPKIRIDRYNGSISISGKAGDYFGQCQAFKAGDQEAKS